MKISDIRPEVYDMAAKAQERLAGRFAEIDRVAEINTRRVMEAFQNNRVAEAPVLPATATTISAGKRSIRYMPRYSARRPRSSASAL